MKTAYANDGMIEMSDQLIALAEAAISEKSGRTDITNIADDELLARYRRMKRG